MTLRRLLQCLPAIAFALWSHGAVAQDSALVVADRVFVDGDELVIAEGNIEAIYGDVRLNAQRITYDATAERLIVAGPIRIDDGGTVRFYAEFAEIDQDLKNGIIRGARMVLNQHLQVVANQDQPQGRALQSDGARRRDLVPGL